MIHKTEYRAGYRPFESVRVIRLARFQCSGRDVNESGKLIDRPGYRHQTLIDTRIFSSGHVQLRIRASGVFGIRVKIARQYREAKR